MTPILLSVDDCIGVLSDGAMDVGELSLLAGLRLFGEPDLWGWVGTIGAHSMASMLAADRGAPFSAYPSTGSEIAKITKSVNYWLTLKR